MQNTTIEATNFPEHERTCPAVGHQKVNVCVPVTITPFAHAGKPKTKCCGEPKITPGTTHCPGVKNGVCTFTLSQTLCIEVPVDFGANTKVGDTFVDCLGASTENICKNCTKGDKDDDEVCSC